MNIQCLSQQFLVRYLNEDDLDLIYDLSSKNTTFYKFHPPFVTTQSIIEDMSALPPQKNKDDKYYVGFFDYQKLVSILDCILAYPEPDTAWIGLFMMNIEYQHQQIGSKIIQEIAQYLKKLGYKKIKLGVDQGNSQSLSFWLKNHFTIVYQENYIIMERSL